MALTVPENWNTFFTVMIFLHTKFKTKLESQEVSYLFLISDNLTYGTQKENEMIVETGSPNLKA